MEEDIIVEPERKPKISERYSDFIDKLILIVSFWLAIGATWFYTTEVKDINWYYHSDKILIFIISFFLIKTTISLFRLILFYGIIGAILWLVAVSIVDVYEDARDPRETEHIGLNKYEFGGKGADQLLKFLDLKVNDDSLEYKLDLLNGELLRLNNKLDSLESAVAEPIINVADNDSVPPAEPADSL
jgi:hypothetical protein